MTAENKYSILNRGNFLLNFQMQLSQKRKTFCEFFLTLSKFRFNFEDFQKKINLIADVFSTYGLRKTWLDKCLKTLVSEDPLTSKMENGPKNF